MNDNMMQALLSLLAAQQPKETFQSAVDARERQLKCFTTISIEMVKVKQPGGSGEQVAARLIVAQSDNRRNCIVQLAFRGGIIPDSFFDVLEEHAKQDESGQLVFDSTRKGAVVDMQALKTDAKFASEVEGWLSWPKAMIAEYIFPEGECLAFNGDGTPHLGKDGRQYTADRVRVLTDVSAWTQGADGQPVPVYTKGYDPVSQGRNLQRRFYHTPVRVVVPTPAPVPQQAPAAAPEPAPEPAPQQAPEPTTSAMQTPF